jgi:hypothetical protein
VAASWPADTSSKHALTIWAGYRLVVASIDHVSVSIDTALGTHDVRAASPGGTLRVVSQANASLKAEGGQFDPVPDHSIRTALTWANEPRGVLCAEPPSDPHCPFLTLVGRKLSHADRTKAVPADGACSGG